MPSLATHEFDDKQKPGGPIPAQAITAALEKILAGEVFRKSRQLSRFLRFAVENALLDNPGSLKESVLGMEVFDRGPDFDPRTDPIVRIDARRLRARLSQYYESEGIADSIRIELEPGSYVPRFRSNRSTAGRPGVLRRIVLPKETGARTILGLLRKGKQQLDLLSVEGSVKGAGFFRNAVIAAPDNALAHLGLAATSMSMALLMGESPRLALSRARTHVARALELDPALVDGHAASGILQVVMDYDFRGAKETFVRALRIKPDAAAVRRAHAMFYLAPVGLLAEAADEIRRLAESEPFSARVGYHAGWTEYLQRNYRGAIATMEKVRKVSPGCAPAKFTQGLAHERLGEYERFREILLADDLRVPYPLLALRVDAADCRRSGRGGEALSLAHRMASTYAPGVLDPVMVGETFALVGDRDRALEWLAKSYEEGANRLIYLKSDPAYDDLREDAQFQEIVEKLGLR